MEARGVAKMELQKDDADEVLEATDMVEIHLSTVQLSIDVGPAELLELLELLELVVVAELVVEATEGASKHSHALLRTGARFVVPQPRVRNLGTVSTRSVARGVANRELQNDEAEDVRDVTDIVEIHLSMVQLRAGVGVRVEVDDVVLVDDELVELDVVEILDDVELVVLVDDVPVTLESVVLVEVVPAVPESVVLVDVVPVVLESVVAVETDPDEELVVLTVEEVVEVELEVELEEDVVV
jgi:hypothetical protein